MCIGGLIVRFLECHVYHDDLGKYLDPFVSPDPWMQDNIVVYRLAQLYALDVHVAFFIFEEVEG